MEVRIVKETVKVASLRTGKIFLYDGDYYMVTDAYTGRYMEQNERVYVNLRTGRTKKFKRGSEDVEPIENISMLVKGG